MKIRRAFDCTCTTTAATQLDYCTSEGSEEWTFSGVAIECTCTLVLVEVLNM